MDSLSKVEHRLKGRAARSMAATNGLVLALDVAMVALSCALCAQGVIDFGQAFVCVAALMSSFGPVIAVANLGSGLQQTLAAERASSICSTSNRKPGRSSTVARWIRSLAQPPRTSISHTAAARCSGRVP